MKDFTFAAYKRYLHAIQASFSNVLRFDEFFLLDPKPDCFCLIRHDVDRKPENALEMARVEYEFSISATYYFRARANVFKPEIIKEVENLGHEIGYHYESLSDKKGDVRRALRDFETNLSRFRTIAPVRTISMHGSPLSSIDNRDLWRDLDNHNLLINKWNILGETYLDIDYSDIAYINDTGRNWCSNKANIRDRVESHFTPGFESGEQLYQYLTSKPEPRMVFQIHPERWSDSITDYYVRFFVDTTMNAGKQIVNLLRVMR